MKIVRFICLVVLIISIMVFIYGDYQDLPLENLIWISRSMLVFLACLLIADCFCEDSGLKSDDLPPTKNKSL